MARGDASSQLPTSFRRCKQNLNMTCDGRHGYCQSLRLSDKHTTSISCTRSHHVDQVIPGAVMQHTTNLIAAPVPAATSQGSEEAHTSQQACLLPSARGAPPARRPMHCRLARPSWLRGCCVAGALGRTVYPLARLRRHAVHFARSLKPPSQTARAGKASKFCPSKKRRTPRTIGRPRQPCTMSPKVLRVEDSLRYG
jgi:hypothetical protein